MTISSVSVSVGETFSKRNVKFATWRTDIAYSATLDEGENPSTVRKELYKKATYDLRIMKQDIHQKESDDY